MAVPTPADREGAVAYEKLGRARQAVREAEELLLLAQTLLESPAAAWGQLSAPHGRERRLLVYGSHRAWAALDKMHKTILRPSVEAGLDALAGQRRDHERDDNPVQEDQEQHETSDQRDDGQLPAGW